MMENGLPNSVSTALLGTPSVGRLVNRILLINPELQTADIISIVRRAIRTETRQLESFHQVQVVDEELALRMARETLNSGGTRNA